MSWYQFLDGWVLREKQYVPEEESSRATVFALANGVFGCRGAPEYLSPKLEGVKGTYINGIYDTPKGLLTEREMPNVQDWTLIQAVVDGDPLDFTTGSLADYRRELNMREGTMMWGGRWTSPSGAMVSVESERLLSMTHPTVGGIRWRLTAETDLDLELLSGVDGDVNNRWAEHFRDVRCRHLSDGVYVETDTFDPGFRIGVATREYVTTGSSVEMSQLPPEGRRVLRQYRLHLRVGESITLTKWAALRENRFTQGDHLEACSRDLDEVTALGFGEVRRLHAERWAELWSQAGVQIEGDAAAQLGIRFSQFHLLSAAPYHNDRISMPARGLQGQDYYGSIFWDFEIFVLPMLAYTQPQAARNALMYRVHTLEGALRKAAALGYRGAYYAWQSQETGDEQCDLYVFTNPVTGEKVRSYFADEQIHISADVVYAMWQYYEATGDVSIWYDGGARVAAEVARFFVSRAVWNEEKKRYELRTVLGPDEYHERIDNNAFTNMMARHAVRRALLIAELVGTAALGVDGEELDEWRNFADKLYVPQPDSQTMLIPQFDGFFDLPDVPLQVTLREFEKPENRFAGVNGPFQKSQNSKQADVVMLLYLFRDQYDTEAKKANWEYYEPRTAHLSSLSPMAYSLVAADVGRMDWAYKYYIHTSHIDLDAAGPHWNLGIHAASLGGAWLAIAHGFCKLRLTLEGVVFDGWPALPPGWSKIEMPFRWHGLAMALVVNQKTVRVVSRFDSATVPVHFPDGVAILEAGETVERRVPAGP
ncbi:MAG: glycoside hydrolase family 65 protein [Fimbriimonadia bacterium]